MKSHLVVGVILIITAFVGTPSEAAEKTRGFSILPGEYLLRVELGESTFEDILRIDSLNYGPPENGFGGIYHCYISHIFTTVTAEGSFESPGLFQTPIRNSCLSEQGDFFVFMIEIDEGRGLKQYIFEFDQNPQTGKLILTGRAYLNTVFPEFATREDMHEVGSFSAERRKAHESNT